MLFLRVEDRLDVLEEFCMLLLRIEDRLDVLKEFCMLLLRVEDRLDFRPQRGYYRIGNSLFI